MAATVTLVRGRDLGQRSDAVDRSSTEYDLIEEANKVKIRYYQASCCDPIITLGTVERPGTGRWH